MRLRLLIVGMTVFLLALTSAPQPSFGQVTHTGTCFHNGTYSLNSTRVVWTNINCTHVGLLVLNGNSSLVMDNSTLAQVWIGTSPGSAIELNGTSVFSLTGSSISFLNRQAPLVMNDSSSLQVAGGSQVTNATIEMNDNSALSVSQGSKIVSNSMTAQSQTSVILNSSSWFSNGGKFVIEGSKFVADHSGVSISNTIVNASQSASIASNQTSITDSYFAIDSVPTTYFGNSSILGSTTTISSSTISVASPTSASTKFSSAGPLLVTGSTISSVVPSKVSLPQSSLSFSGGTVTVDHSTLTSSGADYFGYTPSSSSNLAVISSSGMTVTDSQLTVGQSATNEIFKSANLTLQSFANMTISGTTIQAVASNPVVTLAANGPGTEDNLLFSNSNLVTRNSTGVLSLGSTYSIDIEHSHLNAAQSAFRPSAYSISTVDSIVNLFNATGNLVFGSGVTIGTFYNTTITGCSRTPCFMAKNGGSYSVWGLLNAHVYANSVPIQSVDNASVVAVDPTTGLQQGIASTDVSGVTTMPLELDTVNGSTIVTHQYFVVQSFFQSSSSPQVIVYPTNVMTANLSVAAPLDVANAPVVNQSPASVAAKYGMAYAKYVLYPPGLYAIGQYLGAQYVPSITIISNALPLGYRLNASYSELDFGTVGTPGKTLTFVVIYPKNATTIPARVRVDGIYVTASLQTNATYYYTSFSIPSGTHSLGIVFLLPTAGVNPIQYPITSPPLRTILLLVAVAVVGVAFLALYAWWHDKNSQDKEAEDAVQAPQ